MPHAQPSTSEQAEWAQDQLMRSNARILRQEWATHITRLNFHLLEEGRIAAAINARLVAGSFVFVELLWVNEAHRGRRLGSTLLAHVEKLAKERGAGMIYLDTYSFQARGFYEKQGYRVFGELENLIPGHAKYFLSKLL